MTDRALYFAACLCGRCMEEQPIALYLGPVPAIEEAERVNADPEVTCGTFYVFRAAPWGVTKP